MKRTLTCNKKDSDFAQLVMIDKIAYLSKSQDGETTFIHLDNGEILATEDSIKTLEARIEAGA